MSDITFKYDPWRGGVRLEMGTFVRDPTRLETFGGLDAFGGLLTFFTDQNGRIAAIESFWGRGGLRLKGMHQVKGSLPEVLLEWPQGLFLVPEAEFHIGALHLRQNPGKLELWFGTAESVSPNHWNRREDACKGVVICFSQEWTKAGLVSYIGSCAACHLVAGLSVAFDQTVAVYPIASLRISIEDFK
jgi:hypothetical protein